MSHASRPRRTDPLAGPDHRGVELSQHDGDAEANCEHPHSIAPSLLRQWRGSGELTAIQAAKAESAEWTMDGGREDGADQRATTGGGEVPPLASLAFLGPL